MDSKTLLAIAEDLCNEFKQETAIVKDYNDRRIYLVNGDKEVKKEEDLKEYYGKKRDENSYWLEPRYDSRDSFYKKAYVKDYGDKKELYSYDTLIATIKDGDVEFTKYWRCSQTTLRHLKEFLQQEGFDVGSVNDLYNWYVKKRKVASDHIEQRKDLALICALECIENGEDKEDCDRCGLSEKDFNAVWREAQKEIRQKNKANINNGVEESMKEAEYTKRPEDLIKESKGLSMKVTRKGKKPMKESKEEIKIGDRITFSSEDEDLCSWVEEHPSDNGYEVMDLEIEKDEDGYPCGCYWIKDCPYEINHNLDNVIKVSPSIKESKNSNKGKALKESVNKEELAKWIKNAVEDLMVDEEGTWSYYLGDAKNGTELYCVVGFEAGWGDELRDDCIQSKLYPDYAICCKLAVNSDDLQTDYDWDFNMPYQEDGEVVDTDMGITPEDLDDGCVDVADYILDNYNNIKDCKISRKGLIISCSDEDDYYDESLKKSSKKSINESLYHSGDVILSTSARSTGYKTYQYANLSVNGREAKGVASFINRPWERFYYQSAIKDACRKLGLSDEIISKVDKTDSIGEALKVIDEMTKSKEESLKQPVKEEKKEGGLKMKDILRVIQDLARSQGFYGRLYKRLMEIKDEDQETYNQIVKEWEGQHFSEPLDFILYIEG